MFAYEPCPACGCQWHSILCIYDCNQVIALLNMWVQYFSTFSTLLNMWGGSMHCNNAPRVTKSGNTSINPGDNTPLLMWKHVGLYSPISSEQLTFILKPLWLNWKAAGYLLFAHGMCLTLPSAVHFLTLLRITTSHLDKKNYHLCWDSNLYSWNRTGIVFQLVSQPIQHWDYEDLLVQHGTASSAQEQDLLKKENQELKETDHSQRISHLSISLWSAFLLDAGSGRKEKKIHFESWISVSVYEYYSLSSPMYLLSFRERKISIKMAK